jgi:hypothetical protein
MGIFQRDFSLGRTTGNPDEASHVILDVIGHWKTPLGSELNNIHSIWQLVTVMLINLLEPRSHYTTLR